MKKIGFIDYYLSEWHANNYPAWIRELNDGYTVAYAWAEEDISPRDGVTTAQWCEKNGATPCATIGELCEKSDYVVILAPSDPEKHLQYAKEALPYGKPTYIDKTFAPDLATAQAIFAVAGETPFFSTSALRYAEELAEFREQNHLLITGGGRSFEEYSIHLVEMAVILLGRVTNLKVEHQGEERICRLKGENGKEATLLYAPKLPFTLAGESLYRPVKSEFFKNLMAELLRFFETEKPPFDPAETLAAMQLREALLTAPDGEWITNLPVPSAKLPST